MRRQRWWLPLMVLVFVANCQLISSLPVPEEEVDTSTKLLGSSVVTSVSVVTDDVRRKNIADRLRDIPLKDLLASPGDLLRPDRFQFITYNKHGNVVTKQMTEQEIHSLIAAGGGHLPVEIHEPQKVGDVPSGGMKVADVVQNVQNVLKGELNKPATVMTSIPTIPGHVNTEWSSILPAILGGESETAPVNEPGSPIPIVANEAPIIADTPLDKTSDFTSEIRPLPTKVPTNEGVLSATAADVDGHQDNVKKPIAILETVTSYTEKPMIQVPVITVDQKLPSHQQGEDSKPVFQMLNTISADKIDAKNNTNIQNEIESVVETQHNDHPAENETAGTPENFPVKQTFVKEPVVQESLTNKVPEIIETNFDSSDSEASVVSVRPITTPDTRLNTSESVSKIPEPSKVTVISETHSTSMKFAGHDEIPLQEPAKEVLPPVIQPVDYVQVPFVPKKPESDGEITKKSTTVASNLESTTRKSEVSTERPADTTTNQSIFAQGISFFENLPETVSSIVSDLMNNKPSSSPPSVQEDVKKIPVSSVEIKNPSEPSHEVKNGQTVKPPVVQTTGTQLPQKPFIYTQPPRKQEPTYQIMPEMIPEKNTPVTFSPEVPSIEHIIQTLNDPTSMTGSVAADQPIANQWPQNESIKSDVDKQSNNDFLKTERVPDIQISTPATPINKETPVETENIKPMAPIPTELADSLTSMISQISDTMPSVLPIGQGAGFDTNEKKNVVNMNAEEQYAGPVETAEDPVTQKTEETSGLPVDETAKPVQEPSNVALTNVPEIPELPTLTTGYVKESVSESVETSTSDLPTVTIPVTQLSGQESTTTVRSTETLTSQTPSETPAITVDQLVAGELKPPAPNPQKLNGEADNVVADSQEPLRIENSITKGTTTLATPVKILSTTEPSTTVVATSTTSITPTILVQHTKETAQSSTDKNPIEPPKIQSYKESETEANQTVEPSIVRIDITEAKPTDFHRLNVTQTTENANSNEESPLVRIKLTDAVAQANNMIASSNFQNFSPPPVEILNLPDSGSVPPNTIASGLIAGYPESSTQATITVESSASPSITTSDPVKSELQELMSNDSLNNSSERVSAISNGQTSNLQIKQNITKSETSGGLKNDVSGTEKIEAAETLNSKIVSVDTPVISVEKIDLPIEPVLVESPEKSIISTAKPFVNESTVKSTTVASTEIPVTARTTTIVGNRNATTKIVDSNKFSAEKPTTASSTSELLGATNQTKQTAKVNETLTSLTQPEITTKRTESTDSKMNDETFNKIINSTTTDTTDSRIDVVLENPKPIKTQSTIAPTIEIVQTTQSPSRDEEVFSTILKNQSISTSQSPVTTSSMSGKPPINSNKDKPKFDNVAENSDKKDTIVEFPLADKLTKPSPTYASQQTEQVRIQVNQTAVLVTKRPIPDIPNQKPADIDKSSENHIVREQPTTQKIPTVTEDSYIKLGEKIQLPVPVKVNELASNNEGSSPDASIKKEASGSLTETRIRLDEDKADPNEKNSTKISDTRKPIKKNSDSPPTGDKKVTVSSMTSVPSGKNPATTPMEKKNSTETLPAGTTENPKIPNLKEPAKLANDQIKVPDQSTKQPEKVASTKVSTEKPISKPESKPTTHKPILNIKKDDNPSKPVADDQWTLIPQQIYPTPTKVGGNSKRPTSTESHTTKPIKNEANITPPSKTPVALNHSKSANGLDTTVKHLKEDITYFANLCNELAFSFWTATNKGLSTARSLAVSPFGMTSMLAMVFLGARGPTSDQMNDVLKLDDVASFNPHLVFQNVTDAVGISRNQGIANAAFVRELFADRSKVRKLMPFYKEQAQQFYDGIVAEVNFATISDLVRRRTNLMIRKQTGGRIKDFVRTNTVPLRSPLAALSANVFQTDCNSSAASSEGRDGELYFAVSPAVRQRKLVPVPATVWRAGVLAGYEPSLDATAIALGGADKLVSTIFVIPGQQGLTAPGDTLDRLEQRIVRGATHDGSWNNLLKVLIPRPGLELQVPKFSHRSVINATAALKRMGLEELFSKHADLKGINGVSTDLHLADVLQMNLFSTCGDENIISGRHHVEVYPGSPLRNARDWNEKEEDDPLEDYLAGNEDTVDDSTMPYSAHRAARSAQQQNDPTEKQRLKLDRPFLYFVRHNPTGLILHMGRFNPRLLP